ncbi:hypothetical protein GCM10023231_06600 [Olivibacter ginsenosidimutans]|uniref:Outer membrane protein beta-barrel domain-containing protein n=1 Tax=Olivibacter ginsenosidimutans TaxID=1176537 RepID=A0ABP9AKI9_9SPHI
MKKMLFTCLFSLIVSIPNLYAQGRKVYTVLEAGGMFGLNQPDALGGNRSLNGYKFHLMIGRNFNDHVYVGFGLGNEVYKAKKSNVPFASRFSMLPFLADVRVPIDKNFFSGGLYLIANAGYAPRIGSDMFKGASALGGLNYRHPLSFNGPDLFLTLGYGYQQIVLPYQVKNVQQQSVSLTIGLFIN